MLYCGGGAPTAFKTEWNERNYRQNNDQSSCPLTSRYTCGAFCSFNLGVVVHRGKFWRKFYDHVCVGYKYLRLTYYRLETTDSTTADYYRVYGLAWECFIATHFSPTLSASPCLLLGVMCTSCNHFTCLLKVNENILFLSDTCFDRDIFLPQVRFGIRINEG